MIINIFWILKLVLMFEQKELRVCATSPCFELISLFSTNVICSWNYFSLISRMQIYSTCKNFGFFVGTKFHNREKKNVRRPVRWEKEYALYCPAYTYKREKNYQHLILLKENRCYKISWILVNFTKFAIFSIREI